MDNILIRNLSEKDYLNVCELEKQVHDIHYFNRPDLYNNGSDFFPQEYYNSLIKNENTIKLGLEIDGKIVGIILSEIMETKNIPVIKKRKYCLINDIVIDKQHRRKGYAKMLFNELKNQINGLDVTSIELTVWPFNKEAISFYESLGMTAKNIRYELTNSINKYKQKIEINTSQRVD